MPYYEHRSAIVDHGEKIGNASRGLNVSSDTINIHNGNSAARIECL